MLICSVDGGGVVREIVTPVFWALTDTGCSTMMAWLAVACAIIETVTEFAGAV